MKRLKETTIKAYTANLLRDYSPIKGMEGPFRYPNGRVLYYDKQENGGTYYDRGLDMYIYDEKELDQIMRTAPNKILKDCMLNH